MAIIKKFRIKSFKNLKPVLKLNKVSFSFKQRPILDTISFNLITGLLKPNFGSIIINDKDVLNYPIAERATTFKIGYVPQYGGYFHDLTLLQNLKAIAEIQIMDNSIRLNTVEKIISQFEFDSIINIPAKFLSGGQKKKLVIALSLLNSPKVLLLDEPFAALDVLTIKMLKELIVNLQSQEKISICICDHQARDLLSCVDNAIILSNCKIIAKGTPTQLVNDINAKNAYFGDSFKFN